jgi:hypothetical protein
MAHSVRDTRFRVLLGIYHTRCCVDVLAKSDEDACFMGGVWYVPRSGFIHEWQRNALQGGRTRSHDNLSIDTLCELALHARLLAGLARRAHGKSPLGSRT